MRLTLRTLLAYLDDVLDPADKEELAQKIESSEFAEDLVHRTRDTMRRLRLSAPQVIGTGMGLDPNTVAEYLDNVLPPEHVGDFERICLESDVHLAEAAACHHVLTMVLGEPADFDPQTRQRMYGIPAESRERKQLRVEPAHTKPIAAAAELSPAPSPIVAPAQLTSPIEIPEYLRTEAWWQSRGAVAALAAALLIGIGFYFAGGIRGWFGGSPQLSDLALDRPARQNTPIKTPPTLATEQAMPPTTRPTPTTPLAPPPQPLTPGIAPLNAPIQESVAQSATTDARSTDETDRYAVAAEAADRYAVIPQAPTTTPSSPAPARETQVSLVPETAEHESTGLELTVPDIEVPPVNEELEGYAASTESPTANLPRSEADEMPTSGLPTPPQPGRDKLRVADARPLVPIDADALAEAREESPDVEDEPTGPKELGTYLGGKTVLLRYDDEAGAWLRLQPRDAVVAGQRLVALPEFRPKITLAHGIHVDISGGSQIVPGTAAELEVDGLPTAQADGPALEIPYGRFVMINTSMSESPVRLKVGSTVADARLARNATLAIEVEPMFVPGNDPRKSAAPVVVRLYAPDGGVKWQDASGGEALIASASHWTIEDGVVSEPIADASMPDWIDREPGGQTSEQRFGAPVLESVLVSNQPVDVQLLELFQSGSQRREVKSLVARSSVHVGLFEPFVDALRDSEQRANWRSHIESLRAAMAFSPESATKVRQALVAQRGEQAAADLYQMLCGYNTEQIGRTAEEWKTGAVAQLIDWLEVESLDYRVLAVHCLAEITGKRLLSNPAANAAERAQSVRRWRARLQSGDLKPPA